MEFSDFLQSRWKQFNSNDKFALFWRSIWDLAKRKTLDGVIPKALSILLFPSWMMNVFTSSDVWGVLSSAIYFSLCVWILWFEVTREFFFLFSCFYSIVYIISAPMSPVFGFLVDKIGKNIIWVLCAVVTTLAAHIMLAFTFWNPWIAMVTSVSKRLW